VFRPGECTKSELDLFSVPLTQTSTKNGSWVEYRICEFLPIEFEINSVGLIVWN